MRRFLVAPIVVVAAIMLGAFSRGGARNTARLRRADCALHRAGRPDRLRRRVHRATTSRRCCSTRTRRARGTRNLPAAAPERPADAAEAERHRRHLELPARIRRSGSGWRSATTSRRRSSRTPRVRRTATRTSSTAPTRASPTTSASTRARPSWSCSSIRPAGCRGRPASAATPTQVVRGDGDLQPQPGPEHRRRQQRRLPRHASASSRPTSRSSRRSGVPHAPPARSTRRSRRSRPNPATDLFMNSGDDADDRHPRLRCRARRSIVHDLTTGQTGLDDGERRQRVRPDQLTSRAPRRAPRRRTRSTRCTRPRASTPAFRGPHTRYNVAFSDEIGHFEYCSAVVGRRVAPAPSNNEATPRRRRQRAASAPAFSTLVQIGGCIATDNDFDGTSYQTGLAGTRPNRGQDTKYHPSSILFTSPLFNGEPELQPRRVRGRPAADRGGGLRRHLRQDDRCELRQPAAGRELLPDLFDGGSEQVDSGSKQLDVTVRLATRRAES